MKSAVKLRKTVQNLQEAYAVLAENVTRLTQDDNSLIDEADISKAIESILSFSACQKACIDEYKDLCGEDGCPQNIQEIKDKADEFDAKAAMFLERQEAMKVIGRFDSIKSLSDDYVELLAEASKTLHAIDSEQPIEDYKIATEKYNSFYSAVVEPDSNKRIKCSLSLNDKFHPKLIVGLLQGQLYADAGSPEYLSPEPSVIPESSMVATEPVTADTVQESKPESVTQPDTVPQKSATQNPADNTELSDGSEKDGGVVQSQADIEIVNKLREQGILFDEAEKRYGSVTVETGDETPVKDIKTFRKDMEKLQYGNGFGFLLLQFQNIGTSENLSCCNPLNNKRIDFTNIVESLLNKGYIRKYTIQEKEPYYVVSEKGINALDLKGAFSMLKNKFHSNYIKQSAHSLKETLESAPLSSFAVTCHAQMKIENEVFKHLGYIYTRTLPSRCCFSEVFKFTEKSASPYIISFGAFFESDYIMTQFQSDVFDIVNSNRDCRAVIFTSYDFEQCGKLKDYTMSLTDNLNKARLIYFSFDDNNFFDPDGKLFDVAVIGELMKRPTIEQSVQNEPAVSDEEKLMNEIVPESQELTEEELAPLIELETAVVLAPITKEEPSIISVLEEVPELKYESVPEPSGVNIITLSKRISYDEARRNAIHMLTVNKPQCALSYLKAAGVSNPETACLHKYLAYAYNDPTENITYNSNILLEFVNEDLYQKDDFAKSLIRTAALRNFFSNDIEYDYNMKPLNDIVMSSHSFPEVQWLSNELLTFKGKKRKGLDIYCDYYNKEHIDQQNQIGMICSHAKEYYNQYVLTPYSIEIKMKRYMDTYDMIFGRNSDFSECLRIVSDNEVSSIDIVKLFLNELTEENSYETTEVSKGDINAYIDRCWDACCENEVIHKSTPLVSDLRRRLYSRVSRCLSTMSEWLKLNSMSNSEITPITGREKSEYISKITAAINICKDRIASECDEYEDYISLRDALTEFLAKIDGSYSPMISEKYFYIDFLRGDDVVLNEKDDGVLVPDLKDYCYNIDGMDICSRIMHHAENAGDDFPAAADFNQPKKCDISSLYSFIRYLEMCGKDTSAYSEMYDYFQKPNIQKQQDLSISQAEKSFVEYMELAQSFGKFDITSDSNIKDNILNQTADMLSTVRSTRNYGFFLRMIDGIKAFVEKNAKNQEPAIRQRLENLRAKIGENDPADNLINDNIRTIEEFIGSQNYTAAEDLINRISNGDLYDSNTRYSPELLSDFHNQYSSIYKICYNTATPLAKNTEIARYIRNTTIARKDENGGMKLISSWLIRQNFNTQRISSLLEAFGIFADVAPVSGADSYTKRVVEYYECKLKYADEVRSNYQHIIAPFGSQGYKNSFRVVCLYGAYNCERMLREIDDLSGYNKDTIIFVDYAYQEADRGKLAREMKKRRNNEIYLIVDRVFVTYLAAHYQKTSITKQLMNLAVPFSYYQPYVPDSMNFMTPEMFIGRKKELNDIKSEKGVHMLYGGRQLGKSALLKKAKLEIDHNGDQRAVYIDIKYAGVEEAAKAISNEFVQVGIFTSEEMYYDWTELANAIRRAIKRNKIGYLLLLLDEGDAFIDDCKNYKYQPIDRLKSIMDDPDVRFKFVIAGLHDLVRYDHASSTHDNSVIPHLRPLTIKPFSFAEARELLQYPLSSLGIYFKDDEKNQGLVSTILATTNYFPGLIQFYCSQLVDSLCRDDCPCYSASDLPPYYVSETQIQKLLANEDFTAKIKEKFQITLSLDKDNYYDIIALSLAYLCRDKGIGIGYTSEDILANIEDFNISKVSNLSVERISMLMDELVDLNILRETDNGRYVFSRQNFMQLMGSQDEIFEALYKYGSDAGNGKR